MMHRFRIQGLNKETLGHVFGRDKGAAMQAAVDQGMVTGRKKIGTVTQLPDNDPYEQSAKDIYGEPKTKKHVSFGTWPKKVASPEPQTLLVPKDNSLESNGP